MAHNNKASTSHQTLPSNIVYATSQPKDSPIWSSIIHAKNVLKEGFSWRAGSGSSVTPYFY